ncbi:hypothetical protein SMD44_07604 [Streptomyces alboflavus]|uniref:Uncharacterized protein n=1 Tax=Streptomyces alboflavus TaxID=67267 RepID=A0A1Z1WNU4_9ACTN|nr:hypothetical protein SMD44_07604 [Streptomyces alboflavus]
MGGEGDGRRVVEDEAGGSRRAVAPPRRLRSSTEVSESKPSSLNALAASTDSGDG